jgi:hypothetical protein
MSDGVEADMDQADYVGYHVAGQDIDRDPNGHAQGMTGPVGYWNVVDIEAASKTLLDAGAVQPA